MFEPSEPYPLPLEPPRRVHPLTEMEAERDTLRARVLDLEGQIDRLTEQLAIANAHVAIFAATVLAHDIEATK